MTSEHGLIYWMKTDCHVIRELLTVAIHALATSSATVRSNHRSRNLIGGNQKNSQRKDTVVNGGNRVLR